MLLFVVFMTVAVVLVGVQVGKPIGWIAAGLAVLALIAYVAGWPK